MNSVQLIGRIGADIELKYLPSGKPVASFPIAVDQSYKKDGQKVEKVSWFDIVAFQGAEVINQYFKKGSKIGITGELDQPRWEDQQGNKRSKVIIKLRAFDFIDSKNDNQPKQPPVTQYPPNKEGYQQNNAIPEIDIDDDFIPF